MQENKAILFFAAILYMSGFSIYVAKSSWTQKITDSYGKEAGAEGAGLRWVPAPSPRDVGTPHARTQAHLLHLRLRPLLPLNQPQRDTPKLRIL